MSIGGLLIFYLISCRTYNSHPRGVFCVLISKLLFGLSPKGVYHRGVAQGCTTTLLCSPGVYCHLVVPHDALLNNKRALKFLVPRGVFNPPPLDFSKGRFIVRLLCRLYPTATSRCTRQTGTEYVHDGPRLPQRVFLGSTRTSTWPRM